MSHGGDAAAVRGNLRAAGEEVSHLHMSIVSASGQNADSLRALIVILVVAALVFWRLVLAVILALVTIFIVYGAITFVQGG